MMLKRKQISWFWSRFWRLENLPDNTTGLIIANKDTI